YDATITGFANHAGTTPIAERHDALLAAAHLTVAVRDAVTRTPGRQVGTVGHIEVTPNSPNVIPGLAKLSVELRDLSTEKLAAMMDDIGGGAKEMAANTKTTIAFTPTMKAAPASATSDVQRAIERAAEGLSLGTSRLPSGAGHDAQNMALIGPMGMIFVPSVGGISHSPDELTSWDGCARGADVLLGAVLEMDRLCLRPLGRRRRRPRLQITRDEFVESIERDHPPLVQQRLVRVVGEHDELVVDVVRAQELDEAGRLRELDVPIVVSVDQQHR